MQAPAHATQVFPAHITQTRYPLLDSIIATVDVRDPDTGRHMRRVAGLTAGILHELHVTGPEAALILSAARVHDVGKIGIDPTVLHKPGPLTPRERRLMEKHPEYGVDLLQHYTDFAPGLDIVLHHHERWDGAGYPRGLAGTAIPFGSRVIAVADSFDAMTGDRPYRRGLPVQEAAQILRDGRGRQWDAPIVDAFLHSIAGGLAQPTPVAPAIHAHQPDLQPC